MKSWTSKCSSILCSYDDWQAILQDICDYRWILQLASWCLVHHLDANWLKITSSLKLVLACWSYNLRLRSDNCLFGCNFFYFRSGSMWHWQVRYDLSVTQLLHRRWQVMTRGCFLTILRQSMSLLLILWSCTTSFDTLDILFCKTIWLVIMRWACNVVDTHVFHYLHKFYGRIMWSIVRYKGVRPSGLWYASLSSHVVFWKLGI